MADIINLYAESDRNIIGDDTTPTLTLENSSTGNALKATMTPTTGAVVDFSSKSSSAATVAVLKLGSSTASASALQFAGSCIVSTASGGATVGFGVRVKFGDKYFWMYGYENIA